MMWDVVCQHYNDIKYQFTGVKYTTVNLNALARLFDAMLVHMKPCGLVHSFMSTRTVFSETGKVVGTIFSLYYTTVNLETRRYTV